MTIRGHNFFQTLRGIVIQFQVFRIFLLNELSLADVANFYQQLVVSDSSAQYISGDDALYFLSP